MVALDEEGLNKNVRNNHYVTVEFDLEKFQTSKSIENISDFSSRTKVHKENH